MSPRSARGSGRPDCLCAGPGGGAGRGGGRGIGAGGAGGLSCALATRHSGSLNLMRDGGCDISVNGRVAVESRVGGVLVC